MTLDTPSPCILRMTFETDADLRKLTFVRILRASLSWMGKPGIA